MLPSTTPPTYALAGQAGHGLSILTRLEQAPPNAFCDRPLLASVQKLFWVATGPVPKRKSRTLRLVNPRPNPEFSDSKSP